MPSCKKRSALEMNSVEEAINTAQRAMHQRQHQGFPEGRADFSVCGITHLFRQNTFGSHAPVGTLTAWASQDKEDIGDNAIGLEPAVIFASDSQRNLILLHRSDSYDPPCGKQRK